MMPHFLFQFQVLQRHHTPRVCWTQPPTSPVLIDLELLCHSSPSRTSSIQLTRPKISSSQIRRLFFHLFRFAIQTRDPDNVGGRGRQATTRMGE